MYKVSPQVSNCKHVPADGVVRMQNKCEILNCLTYRGGDRKNISGTVTVIKKIMNNFKNCKATPTFRVMEML